MNAKMDRVSVTEQKVHLDVEENFLAACSWDHIVGKGDFFFLVCLFLFYNKKQVE